MSAAILLVEDDEQLGTQVVAHLLRAGYLVDWLRNGSLALDADPRDFGLLVLDLMLPGAPGLNVLERWRRRTDAPVLILSAMSSTDTKVRALTMGADDFLQKPFWPEELLARVHAVLRRPGFSREDVLACGPIVVDLVGHLVLVEGKPVELTRVEFELLRELARHPGRALSRKWLVEHVLEPRGTGDSRTLDVHFSRLRRKLGSHGSLLQTVWNVGYRLDGEAPA